MLFQLLMAKYFWGIARVAHKVDLRLAPALQTLDQLLTDGEENTFDFAFIDADKANYEAYYEYCLQLVRKAGVIAIDNVLWMGRLVQHDDGTAATKAIRALNEKIHQDSRVDMVTLSIGGGLTLIRKI